MENDAVRYYSLSTYFRQRFGCRVQKVPLDAGFSCPNRDGTLSRAGCTFCSPHGSGSGLLAQGMELAAQWDHWIRVFEKRRRKFRFMAYLQSFSNTHGPLEKVEDVLRTIAGLPGCEGVSLGTRPDCLDGGRLELLEKYSSGETWLELGLQSANDATLARVNRGHDAAMFARACERADALGLKVCAHVIFGLPGEGHEDAMRTVAFVNGLPVRGVKFHNLFICKGCALARDWRAGLFEPMEHAEFVRTLLDGVERLRPDIVVHRLSGDALEGKLLAPQWAANKGGLLGSIRKEMVRRETWQGRLCGAGEQMPEWFDIAGEMPGVLRQERVL